MKKIVAKRPINYQSMMKNLLKLSFINSDHNLKMIVKINQKFEKKKEKIQKKKKEKIMKCTKENEITM